MPRSTYEFTLRDANGGSVTFYLPVGREDAKSRLYDILTTAGGQLRGETQLFWGED